MTDPWLPIVSQYLNSLEIRAMLIVNKTLNETVNQHRVDLVIANKDRCFIISNIRMNSLSLFDDEILQKLKNPESSLETKASQLMSYINEKIPCRVLDHHLLDHFACEDSNSETLDVLLKLVPRLNTVRNSYMPTALFWACHERNAPNFINAKKLIDAGADFRIKNPQDDNCFSKCGKNVFTEVKKQKLDELENEAKELWETLGRDNTPVPEKAFTIQNARWNLPTYQGSDYFDDMDWV